MLKQFRASLLGFGLVAALANPAWAIFVSATLSLPGVSAAVPLDTSKAPPTALLVNIPSGVTASCEVDVSGGPQGPWNPHDTLVGLTASANGNLAYPVGFVRLNCASLSGVTTSPVTLTAIQQDTPNR